MTRLAHLNAAKNKIFVPLAGSPGDAGDRAAASRSRSASAPPRAWKEEGNTGLFFCSAELEAADHSPRPAAPSRR